MLEILSEFHFHEGQKTGNEKIKKHNYLELYNENKYLSTLIWQERNYFNYYIYCNYCLLIFF